MWIQSNPNEYRREEPDCVVRAIAIATGQTWEKVHWDLCVLSHRKHTMPNTNWLWGLYLEQHGFEKFMLPQSCPECVTVREFARRFPNGTYVVSTGNHAVAVISGNWMDEWDSGGEVPIQFYKRSE